MPKRIDTVKSIDKSDFTGPVLLFIQNPFLLCSGIVCYSLFTSYHKDSCLSIVSTKRINSHDFLSGGACRARSIKKN